jgi:membrane-bound metal-dependent hydrolase YbcI (DUF457 family)
MGRTHAATGAATWLVGCAIAASEGVQIGVHHVVVGAGLMAYGAVLPDIDMPRSNVALSLGWPTRFLARRIAGFGAWLHDYTRLPKDRVDKDGHRCITHTILFCLVVMFAVGALGQNGGLWAPLVFVLVATATAVRSLLKPGSRRMRVRLKNPVGKGGTTVWVSRPVVAGLIAGGMMWMWPAPAGWWLGVAVGGGCLIHNLGDAMTNTGVPLFFPWEIKGCRWYTIRVRESWRFETKQESTTERWIYRGCALASVAAFGLVVYLAWPVTIDGAVGWATALVDGWTAGTVGS